MQVVKRTASAVRLEVGGVWCRRWLWLWIYAHNLSSSTQDSHVHGNPCQLVCLQGDDKGIGVNEPTPGDIDEDAARLHHVETAPGTGWEGKRQAAGQ